MKINKPVLDAKNFDRDSFLGKLMEFIRSGQITKKEQVHQILNTGHVTPHQFVDWFFDSLGKLSGKNRTNWDDLSKLIDMDVFPRTFAIRKLNFTDKFDNAPQSFQEKYASVDYLIRFFERKIK
jgi:hypothetical protein